MSEPKFLVGDLVRVHIVRDEVFDWIGTVQTVGDAGFDTPSWEYLVSGAPPCFPGSHGPLLAWEHELSLVPLSS